MTIENTDNAVQTQTIPIESTAGQPVQNENAIGNSAAAVVSEELTVSRTSSEATADAESSQGVERSEAAGDVDLTIAASENAVQLSDMTSDVALAVLGLTPAAKLEKYMAEANSEADGQFEYDPVTGNLTSDSDSSFEKRENAIAGILSNSPTFEDPSINFVDPIEMANGSRERQV